MKTKKYELSVSGLNTDFPEPVEISPRVFKELLAYYRKAETPYDESNPEFCVALECVEKETPEYIRHVYTIHDDSMTVQLCETLCKEGWHFVKQTKKKA